MRPWLIEVFIIVSDTVNCVHTMLVANTCRRLGTYSVPSNDNLEGTLGKKLAGPLEQAASFPLPLWAYRCMEQAAIAVELHCDSFDSLPHHCESPRKRIQAVSSLPRSKQSSRLVKIGMTPVYSQ